VLALLLPLAHRRRYATEGIHNMADKGSRGFPFETPYAEIRRLRAENARLRQLLSAHGIPIPPLGLEDRPAEVLPSSSARLPAPVVTTLWLTKRRRRKSSQRAPESEPLRVGARASGNRLRISAIYFTDATTSMPDVGKAQMGHEQATCQQA